MYRLYDASKEKQGVEVELPTGGFVTVRRWLNSSHRRALGNISVRNNGRPLPEDEQERAEREAIVPSVLVGWRDVPFEDAETGELTTPAFTEEAARDALVRFEDFFIDVRNAALQREQFYRARAETAAKN